MEDQILALIVGLPLIGAIGTVVIPKEKPVWVYSLAVGVAAIGFLLSIILFFSYDFTRGGYQFAVEYPWLSSLGITFHIGVDGITVPMILLNGVVFFAATLVSSKVVHRPKDFFFWLFLLVAGVYGVFVSLDLFFLFFFYELAVVPMYLLIAIWGSSSDFGNFSRTKEYGAMKLVLYLVAGSVLVWIAIIALWLDGGHVLGLLALEDAEFSRNFQIFVFPLVAVGFGILAGMWPFHTWSPDGHVAAPTAVSMLHAGVLMKLGAFGILRVGMVLLPDGLVVWAPVLMGLATVNVIYGSISALAQKDLKYVIGYSSVSHMGYVVMGLATLEVFGITGAVLQMFSHGVMTALFFAMVGVIYNQSHLRDIGQLEGLTKRMKLTSGFFAIAGLASLGLPGLSGFVAELMVFIGVFKTYLPVGFLAVIGAAITAVYILRLLGKVFFGPIDQRWQQLEDLSRLEFFGALLLIGFLVLWGVYPWPIVELINSAVVPLIEGITR